MSKDDIEKLAETLRWWYDDGGIGLGEHRINSLAKAVLDAGYRPIPEGIREALRGHWTGYDTSEAPAWVKATLSGTQEDIENLLGKPSPC